MTLDERLKALVQTVELISRDVEDQRLKSSRLTQQTDALVIATRHLVRVTEIHERRLSIENLAVDLIRLKETAEALVRVAELHERRMQGLEGAI
jgi:hypothetical protein